MLYPGVHEALSNLLTEWKKEAIKLVSGPWEPNHRAATKSTEWILARRSGKLSKSFRKYGPKMTLGSIAKSGLSMYIKLINYAKDPETGFSYAAYHEYQSGLRFLRPALSWVLDSRNPNNKADFIYKSYLKDSGELLMTGLARHGWKRGATPRTAFRTVVIDVGGGAITEPGRSLQNISGLGATSLRSFR